MKNKLIVLSLIALSGGLAYLIYSSERKKKYTANNKPKLIAIIKPQTLQVNPNNAQIKTVTPKNSIQQRR